MEAATAIKLGGAALGMLNSLSTPRVYHDVGGYVNTGTALASTKSSDVFGLLGRYKQGKDNYKSFLNRSAFGQISKITNTDLQAKTTSGFAKMYGNTNNTSMNRMNSAIGNYLANSNKTMFGAASKEAQQNMSNYNALKANTFNNIRFTKAVTESDKQYDSFAHTLAKAKKFNDDSMNGVYKV